MAFLEKISKNMIKVPLLSLKKEAVIKELIELAEKAGKIDSAEEVFSAVMAREALGSTGLEDGIAVPHAKTKSVKDLIIAVGLAEKGIDFKALDGKPSRIFFLILAPPDQSGPHIEALSEIARLARSRYLLKMLEAARTADEIFDIFNGE
jgi:fructose-specific phosphotransferase system IIA component